jgi:hypothetical protein
VRKSIKGKRKRVKKTKTKRVKVASKSDCSDSDDHICRSSSSSSRSRVVESDGDDSETNIKNKEQITSTQGTSNTTENNDDSSDDDLLVTQLSSSSQASSKRLHATKCGFADGSTFMDAGIKHVVYQTEIRPADGVVDVFYYKESQFPDPDLVDESEIQGHLQVTELALCKKWDAAYQRAYKRK